MIRHMALSCGLAAGLCACGAPETAPAPQDKDDVVAVSTANMPYVDVARIMLDTVPGSGALVLQVSSPADMTCRHHVIGLTRRDPDSDPVGLPAESVRTHLGRHPRDQYGQRLADKRTYVIPLNRAGEYTLSLLGCAPYTGSPVGMQNGPYGVFHVPPGGVVYGGRLSIPRNDSRLKVDIDVADDAVAAKTFVEDKAPELADLFAVGLMTSADPYLDETELARRAEARAWIAELDAAEAAFEEDYRFLLAHYRKQKARFEFLDRQRHNKGSLPPALEREWKQLWPDLFYIREVIEIVPALREYDIDPRIRANVLAVRESGLESFFRASSEMKRIVHSRLPKHDHSHVLNDLERAELIERLTESVRRMTALGTDGENTITEFETEGG